jgi:hypothetical protein
LSTEAVSVRVILSRLQLSLPLLCLFRPLKAVSEGATRATQRAPICHLIQSTTLQAHNQLHLILNSVNENTHLVVFGEAKCKVCSFINDTFHMNIFIIFKVIADCVIQSVTAGVENEITWEHLQISPMVQRHPSIFLAYLMRHLLRKLNLQDILSCETVFVHTL